SKLQRWSKKKSKLQRSPLKRLETAAFFHRELQRRKLHLIRKFETAALVQEKIETAAFAVETIRNCSVLPSGTAASEIAPNTKIRNCSVGPRKNRNCSVRR